ncbi:MAG: pyridoxamine 5'-phosphate oxidase family protein [Actinomycetota bacterium]|nr:pyridoxamine 5'-phosphate oxidase family protein [Actinomycetota bacterium]
MTSWQEVTEQAPELAAAIRDRFAVRRHCTMATLRADGSPRISGTEVEFADGQLWIGSMPRARKALDLRRDSRMALHSPTVDPPDDDPGAWPGEAKVAGRAVEVANDDPAETSHRFRIDIAEVVLTRVSGDALLVESWHPGRGLEERVRR